MFLRKVVGCTLQNRERKVRNNPKLLIFRIQDILG